MNGGDYTLYTGDECKKGATLFYYYALPTGIVLADFTNLAMTGARDGIGLIFQRIYVLD